MSMLSKRKHDDNNNNMFIRNVRPRIGDVDDEKMLIDNNVIKINIATHKNHSVYMLTAMFGEKYSQYFNFNNSSSQLQHFWESHKFLKELPLFSIELFVDKHGYGNLNLHLAYFSSNIDKYYNDIVAEMTIGEKIFFKKLGYTLLCHLLRRIIIVANLQTISSLNFVVGEKCENIEIFSNNIDSETLRKYYNDNLNLNLNLKQIK